MVSVEMAAIEPRSARPTRGRGSGTRRGGPVAGHDSLIRQTPTGDRQANSAAPYRIAYRSALRNAEIRQMPESGRPP